MNRHRTVAVFVPHLACPNRCSFCDQRAISGAAQAPSPKQVQALLERAAGALGGSPAEIAFFGGSFTAVEPAYMRSLLAAAQPFLGEGFTGIRVSTRPDAVTQDIVETLVSYGVSMVELGAQSMDDGILRRNGRGHTAGEVAAAARLIRENGLGLGLQMMTGLCGDTDGGAWKTARALVALEPDCVRVYPTVVLRHTRLKELWDAGEYHPQPLEDAVALCAGLLEFFYQGGIPVIRLGLHHSESLEQNRVAGPYHPAFRELCEGRLYLQRALAQLWERRLPPGRVTLGVTRGAASKMAGQKRANIAALRERGYRPAIRERDDLAYLEVAVSADKI